MYISLAHMYIIFPESEMNVDVFESVNTQGIFTLALLFLGILALPDSERGGFESWGTSEIHRFN